MPGAIGIDVQDSRTAIALLESAEQGSVAAAIVGDGYRSLVPHAWTPGAWGSLAAQEILGALGADATAAPARLAAALTAWQRDAWGEEFLRGIRHRLDEYTGRTPLNAYTYQLAVCADPETADAALVPQRYESAGLPAPQFVDPPDALVCRWLSEATTAPPDGSVLLVVACGESRTVMRTYAVTGRGGSPVLRAGRQARIAAGAGVLSTVLAGDVLARCRPGVPAPALLSLLDGTLEFAAALRARPDRVAQWSGPLSEYLFAPVRMSPAELLHLPEVAQLRGFFAADAARLLDGQRAAVVVVGGPGAVWPFPAAELAACGPVWQSLEPELDLAVGACWRPLLSRFLSAPPAATAVRAGTALPSAPATARQADGEGAAGAAGGPPSRTDYVEVPPWER